MGIGFAALLSMLSGNPPAVAGPISPTIQDNDGDGVEDVLEDWRDGKLSWEDLRSRTLSTSRQLQIRKSGAAWQGAAPAPEGGAWERGLVRILQIGGGAAARDRAGDAGEFEVLHDLARLDASVLALDARALEAYLDGPSGGQVLLDRDGVPALGDARKLIGLENLTGDPWQVGNDWSGTVAILDSGCDTAHGDLGDKNDDDLDGPAPAVGDDADWYDARQGWPVFDGYKVVGWHDVTDDFPAAQGPWDYHYHGTALASAVAGAGYVDADHAGVAAGGRLTVVKFYDFDVTWHAWAGDFLAACDWVIANRETYRVRAVLAAVNWDVDAGVGVAINALIDAGIVPVVAMGNYGRDPGGPGYPARLSGVVACGGVNADGAVSAFSGRGAANQGKPDLMAPAGGLLAAGGRIEVCDNDPDDTYSGRYGTSLAAAHVAGAVYLLDEAVRDRGVTLPTGRDGVLLRKELLKATATPLYAAETADGTGLVALAPPESGDTVQGAGLLRVDAAVAAVCDPLQAGIDAEDEILPGWERPVVARRLVTSPGVRYLVEAQPEPGLDIQLEICDPWGRLGEDTDASASRDASGPGVSEFIYVRPAEGHWLSVVVKRVSGEGTVTLRLLEEDTFPAQGRRNFLPGPLTGNVNVGDPLGTGAPTLVIPSHVTVDDAARAVNLLRTDGTVPAGWPSFLFPHISAQGGLSQPLVWDLDGLPGDEIVVTAEYGTVYFFEGDGSHIDVNLGLNLPLTLPVGIEAGERRVVCVDNLGGVFAWAAGGVLRASADLGHQRPLAPAVGILAPEESEAVVVAFADGNIFVLDGELAVRSGWPRDLGMALATAPILVDLDEDGDHEIIVPVLDEDSGTLRMRILTGDGSPGPDDGYLLAAPGGGDWFAVSAPMVTGRYGTGELGVTVAGLTEIPLDVARSRWALTTATLRQGGGEVTTHPSLAVIATTDAGQLLAENMLLAPPLAWNQTGGTGAEPAMLVGLEWVEILYGVTTIPGAGLGWYVAPDPGGRPLAAWQPLLRGGPAMARHGRAGAALVDNGDGSLLRIHAVDAEVVSHPVLAGAPGGTPWLVERADGRNSGALALEQGVSGTTTVAAPGFRLRVYPNPGSDRIRFHLEGGRDGGPVSVEIFDVRGRRVRRLNGQAPALVWDGRDRSGRTLAAGAYLAVVRQGDVRQVQRVVLTR